MRNDDNVIAFPRRRPPSGDRPVPVAALAGAVGAINDCLAEFSLEPASGDDPGAVSVAALLLQISAVERWLEKLAEITVVTWPDVRWALRFCDARVRVVARIRESAAALHAHQSSPAQPRVWRARATLIAETQGLDTALREIRDLIVERYPQTQSAC